jgi:hypothetical protein
LAKNVPQHLAKHHIPHMHQPCTRQTQLRVTFLSSTKLRIPWKVNDFKISKWRRLMQCHNFYRSSEKSINGASSSGRASKVRTTSKGMSQSS